MAEKSPEKFLKHKGFFSVSEYFDLNCRFKQKLLFDLEKFIEYLASAVNVVSSNPYNGPMSRIKISLSLRLIFRDELISTLKMIEFLPTLTSGNENSEHESNPIP